MPIGLRTSQAPNFVGASNPNQVVSTSVIPETYITSSSMYAVIENGTFTSVSLIFKRPTIVSSIFESKLLFGKTISSTLYVASGKILDSSQFFWIAPSLMLLPLFNVLRSAVIARSSTYKQESAESQSLNVSLNSPDI